MPRLSIDVEARIAQLQDSMSRVEKSVTGSAERMQKAFAGVSAALGAIAGVAGLEALRRTVTNVLDTADGLNKLSQKSGIAVERLSELSYAAKLSDVSSESLATALRALNKSIDDGADGFGRLGISTRNADGTLRSTDAVLLDVAERFSGIQDGAAKAAIAQDLFGKSGTDVIPLLNAGRAGIAAYADEAQRLGIVISGDTARAAEQFNDNVTRLRESFSGLAVSAAQSVLPALLRVSEELLAGARAAGGFVNAVTQLGTINPFRDLGENLRAYRNDLEAVQKKRDQYAAMGASTDRFDEELKVLRARIEFLKFQERSRIPAGGADSQDARDLQLAQARTQEVLKAAAIKTQAVRTGKTQSDNDRAAVEAAKELGQQLSAQARERAAVAEAYNRVDLAAMDERQRAAIEAATKAAGDLQAILARTQSGQLAELERQQLVLNDALVAGTINAEQFNEAFAVIDSQRNGVLGRVADDFAKVEKTGSGAFDRLEAAVRGWGNAFTDTLADAVMTGKLNFASLVESVLRDLLRMQIQASITTPLFAAFQDVLTGSFFSGGAKPGTPMAQPGLKLPGRASGGPVSSGMPYMVGENGPELFVPGAAGTIVPSASGAGVTMNMVVNVDARSDAASVRQAVMAAANLARAQISRDMRVGR